MNQELKFETLSREEAQILLKAYDYDLDSEDYIIDTENNKRITENGEYVHISNAALLPGSLRINKSDPLSLSEYMRESEEDGS